MRTHLPRLVGALAATALTLTALGAAAPSQADEPGTLTVTVVDDRGAPAVAVPYLVGADGLWGATWFDTTPGSTFSHPVPAGSYGIGLMGGWGGLTCLGLTVCDPPFPIDAPTASRPTGAVVVADGATTKVTVTMPTPGLAGSGAVGSPLTVTVPAGLTAAAKVMAAQSGGSVDPAVTWLRDGLPIAGASGLSYTPTASDRQASISARLVYPTALDAWRSGPASAMVPEPITTPAVAVADAIPTITLSVPKRFRQGQRPKAKVTVAFGANPMTGIVKLRVGKKRARLEQLRAGRATFKLPKLKPGKYAVTARYLGADGYPGVTTSTKVVVKKRHRK